MTSLQLDLFESPEITSLRSDFAKVKESSDKVRKGLYAENGALKKRVTSLEQRLELLEKNICVGNFNDYEMKIQKVM